MVFDKKLLPTLNIWWNNGGYPDEEGCRRFEVAIEPVIGSCGSLAAVVRDGTCATLSARGKTAWRVEWILSGK